MKFILITSTSRLQGRSYNSHIGDHEQQRLPGHDAEHCNRLRKRQGPPKRAFCYTARHYVPQYSNLLVKCKFGQQLCSVRPIVPKMKRYYIRPRRKETSYIFVQSNEGTLTELARRCVRTAFQKLLKVR